MAAASVSSLGFLVASHRSCEGSRKVSRRIQDTCQPIVSCTSTALCGYTDVRSMALPYRISVPRGHRKGSRRHHRTSAGLEEGSDPASPPQITLTFLKPSGESERVLTVVSGESQLRRLMLAEKVPLYSLYGKLMNCGGGGNCATCLVEIREGGDLLNEKTDAEDRQLNKKPANWRLACQTIIGDKTNSGKVLIQTLPQTVSK